MLLLFNDDRFASRVLANKKRPPHKGGRFDSADRDAG